MILSSYYGIDGKAQNLKSINLDAKLLGLLAASDGGLRQVADLPPVQKGSLAVLAGGKLPTASCRRQVRQVAILKDMSFLITSFKTLKQNKKSID